MEYAIETRGLSKTYRGGTEALKPIDIKVRAGTRFGLLGPNGAGKSTLVKSLLDIVHASGGSATLLGRDHRQASVRKDIGYLPEGHRFPRYLTGEGVCRYFGQLRGISGAQLKSEIEKKLALVGMSEWADTKITNYSKGMNQRVGLAQALLGNPRLVFLDEPTDGVDPQGRREIRDVIKEAASDGATIFFNSHLLSEVEVICDEIAILKNGALVTQGTVDEIKAQTSGRAGERGSLTTVHFKTDAIADAAWQDIGLEDARRDNSEAFAVDVNGPQATTAIIDRLRAASVIIHSIRPREIDLEDAFLDLIKNEGEVVESE